MVMNWQSRAPLLALTVKLPYVPVASPVKLSTASWSTSLALTVPAAVKGLVLGGGAALEPPTDHRRVIGAGDRDGDVLGGGRP